jgi:hypothetical protein
MERKRRGCSEKLIVTGENMKKPPDWKTFLANEENKKQLIELRGTCFTSLVEK